jgi:hypothetical protein
MDWKTNEELQWNGMLCNRSLFLGIFLFDILLGI